MSPQYRERELFADAGSFTRCQCCNQRLSTQSHANHRTKLFGLCFVCLAEFDRSEAFVVETFLKSANRCKQMNRRKKITESRRRRLQAWIRQEHAEIQERLTRKRT
jgi:hypothetical protein